jgi:peptidoglycan/LPS O-acetylase OafA/YrhL
MHGPIRREIQGLRAIAVLLVIANHLRDWPSGGFVGVDVFFVVSGYVITRLLLREADRSGRISLTAFYRRRVKRIMPAALLVLVSTVIVASVLYSPTQQVQARTDVAWAAGFAANWRFVIIGTDYLHAADAVSPVQHFWSLSVEEQFYFVWPLLVIAAIVLTRRHPSRLRAILGGAAAVIAVVSFVYALRESVALPTAAYFSTLSRGWELAVGCLTACAAPWTRRLPMAAQTPLAWAGFIGIIVSVFIIDASTRFPAPGAALPVLATATILAVGERGELQNLYPLTNRFSSWIGDLSYSLYLWHFPVLIFLDSLLPGRGRRYELIAGALMLTLALLSYYFVENPLRKATWHLPRPQARSGPARVGAGRRRWRPALSAVALVLVGVSVSAFAVQSRPANAAQPVDVGSAWTNPTSTAAAAEGRAVDRSLAAATWPTLTPAVQNPGVTAEAPEWVRDGCLGDERGALPDPYTNALRCVYGDPKASKTLAVVGDSHAISYLPGVRAALKQGWRIEVYAVEECPAVWVTVNRSDGAPHPDCPRFQREVARHLAQIHPSEIMMTSANIAMSQLASHASGDALVQEWKRATAATVAAFAKATDRLILVDDPPQTMSLPACYTALNGPGHCVMGVTASYLQMVHAQQSAVAELGLRNVSYPTNTQWFCSSSGLCPSFIGTTPVSVDGFHLTDTMARNLAPVLRAALIGPSGQ